MESHRKKMKIQDLTGNLTVDSHGIWVTGNNRMEVSYPEEGNQQYQVRTSGGVEAVR